ncbi:MAG: phosphatidylglycerophosphatase A [Candidatus Goldbacteria bacterium]|nr:phosphatidylglycerophosphatase A [Candidatus Goldiibacteriota bacterium]
MRNFIIIFTSFFGTGYFPKGSGTFATFCFLPVYYFLFRNMPPIIYLSVILVLIFLGIWASNYAIVIFKSDDPHKVVIDEVVGFLITMFFIPYSLKRLVIGFFIARILDIIKPWPAYQSQKLRGGNGIMADDVIAGIYGNILMWVLIFFKII